MIDPLNLKDIELLRQEGLKALSERLGPVGMVNFIRLFNDGYGNYSEERHEYIGDITEKDFLEFIDSKNE